MTQEVAGQVRKHHEAHTAVSRRETFKLSHVVQDRLAKGVSSQGFGPQASQAQAWTTLESLPEEVSTMPHDVPTLYEVPKCPKCIWHVSVQ